MDEPESFGEWLKQRRRALHLTQEAVAEQLYCALGTLRKIEADERRPSQELAELLAQVLQVPEEHQSMFVKVARAELALDRLALPPDPANLPRIASPRQPPTNLRLPRSSFVGRDTERAQVHALVLRAEVGLLTLTGPGGIGKTRLALEVAAELRDEFADGVFFVDLAPISDPALVASTIATVLGIKETRGQTISVSLMSYICDRQLLLLLDNFEQVIGAAPVVAELLAAAPLLKVLVTSREVLHLYGEQEYPVQPLTLPSLARLPSLPQLSQYTAVQLFIQRVQAARPEFQITNENAPAVAEICTRLDGLPLAIELAAARVKLLPPQALLARLNNRLKYLTGGARERSARQRTLRGTIDWSYHLLDVNEQQLFCQLAVIVGGCTLEAAEAICTAAGGNADDVLDGIASLVDKSLLRQHPEGTRGVTGEPRFTMFETIREYALEQLEASGEAGMLRRQHAHFYLTLAERAAAGLRGPTEREWLLRLEAEHGNLRAALGWALEHQEATTAAQLVGALYPFWQLRGYLSEGRQWLEQSLAQADSVTLVVRAKVLDGSGSLATFQGDYGRAQDFYTASLALYYEVDDKQGIAFALANLGRLARLQGNYVAAQSFIEESLALTREMGGKQGIALSLKTLILLAYDQGNYAAAQSFIEESLAITREIGDKQGIAFVLANVGRLSSIQGDYATAQSSFIESLALNRELGDRQGIAFVLDKLGLLAHVQGDYAAAQSFIEESLRLNRELGHKVGIAGSLHGLGLLAHDQGNYAVAQSFYIESLTLYRDVGHKLGSLEVLEAFAALASGLGWAERALRLAGVVEIGRKTIGAPLTPRAQAKVEHWLERARAVLDLEVQKVAWTEGQAMTLEQAVAYALEETNSE